MGYQREFVENPVAAWPSPGSNTLIDRDLILLEGLDESIARELIEHSQEPHVIEYCPNDAASRFANMAAVEKWLQKGRLTFPLIKLTPEGLGELAGFGWIGPGVPGDDEPEIPGAKTTFAIRLYSAALGQGNALPFTQAMLFSHDKWFGNKGVWLETWGDNSKAIATYRQAGFIAVAETLGVRRGKAYPRLYMTLGELAAGQHDI